MDLGVSMFVFQEGAMELRSNKEFCKGTGKPQGNPYPGPFCLCPPCFDTSYL